MPERSLRLRAGPALSALLVLAAGALLVSPKDSFAQSCFRTRSALAYASDVRGKAWTGIVSGTRVTFRRRPHGWTGVSVDLQAQRPPAVLQDLLLDAEHGRVYYLMPRRSGEPLIVQGRIDCDSLWGTSRPRYSKQEPTPIVFRRVRVAR